MRLWHKNLIPYLPRQQLLGQWRECCCIARNISINGTPNHILVNKIMDYPIEHFNTYTWEIYKEMQWRGYRCNWIRFGKWRPNSCVIDITNTFSGWHNGRYLHQCLCNLQEKYDCGGISNEEWLVIANRFDEEMRFCP